VWGSEIREAVKVAGYNYPVQMELEAAIAIVVEVVMEWSEEAERKKEELSLVFLVSGVF
jgi:hypothetical protein